VPTQQGLASARNLPHIAAAIDPYILSLHRGDESERDDDGENNGVAAALRLLARTSVCRKKKEENCGSKTPAFA
jgi:hypothetical protein